MRSAAQFQINKIGKLDQSTKDVILGCSKITDQMNIKTKISDHNAIIATLNFTKDKDSKSDIDKINDDIKSVNSKDNLNNIAESVKSIKVKQSEQSVAKKTLPGVNQRK